MTTTLRATFAFAVVRARAGILVTLEIFRSAGRSLLGVVEALQLTAMEVLADDAFEAAEFAKVFAGDEGDRGAGRERAASTADTVDVVFELVREVEVKDVGDTLDVDTARSDVGGDKHANLANAKGLSLYTSKADKPNQSNCADACARTWIPLAAPWAATNRGEWTAVKRADGTKQWAYRGQPLYTHAGDAQASATSGDGLDPKWQVAVVEPPPPVPGFVKVHQSDAGELYTDGRGKTLYQREVKRAAGLGFNEADLQSVTVPRGFQPVTPENTEDAKPVGNWALVDNGGKKQWAYKGLALYTNDNDIAPGDLKGVRGTDRSFYTIMRSGELMQGTGQ